MMRETLLRDLNANCSLSGSWGLILGWLIVPSFRAILYYRLMRRMESWRLSSIMSRLLWLRNARMGIYISPKSQIGSGLRLPHPVSVVVGDDSVVGENVTLYQGVTLGRRTSSTGEYPVLGKDVVVYAGACVLGGVSIGERAVIGANAVVVSDVPPGATAVGIPAKVIPRKAASDTGEAVERRVVTP